MKIGAFFDIDGTIARDSLMIEHFKKLVNFEIIDQKLYYEKVYPAYQKYEKEKLTMMSISINWLMSINISSKDLVVSSMNIYQIK